jgi:putative intracellular protease/amidase
MEARDEAEGAVLCADGSEEMEVVIPVDMLRRGGVDVTPGLPECWCRDGSRGIRLMPDAVLNEGMQADALVLPGGLGGVEVFLEDPRVHRLVKKHAEAGAWICAHCAAPLCFRHAGCSTPQKPSPRTRRSRDRFEPQRKNAIPNRG